MQYIIYEDMGNRIREERKKQGLTQADLAEKVGAGVTHISHIETGSGSPSLKLLISIINVLGISPGELFCGYAQADDFALQKELSALFDDCTEEEMKQLFKIIEFSKKMIRENRW